MKQLIDTGLDLISSEASHRGRYRMGQYHQLRITPSGQTPYLISYFEMDTIIKVKGEKVLTSFYKEISFSDGSILKKN